MSFQLVRFVMASTFTAALLAACGASTGDQHQAHGGAAGSGSAGEGAGGSKAGASSGGASGSGGQVDNGGTGGAQAGAGGASGAGGHAGASGASAGGAAGSNGVCGPSQYLVIPCCGGAPPACVPLPAEGKCPSGSHSGCIGGLGGIGGCTPPATCCQLDPCTPPAPYCSDTEPVGCFTEGRTCRMGCA